MCTFYHRERKVLAYFGQIMNDTFPEDCLIDLTAFWGASAHAEEALLLQGFLLVQVSFRVLQNIAEYYRVLQSIAEYYRIFLPAAAARVSSAPSVIQRLQRSGARWNTFPREMRRRDRCALRPFTSRTSHFPNGNCTCFWKKALLKCGRIWNG